MEIEERLESERRFAHRSEEKDDRLLRVSELSLEGLMRDGIFARGGGEVDRRLGWAREARA